MNITTRNQLENRLRDSGGAPRDLRTVCLGAEVVALHLTMPVPSPLAAIHDPSVRVSSCRVIALGGYDDRDTRDGVRRVRASGLVSKHGESPDIILAIRRSGGESRPQAMRPAPSGMGGASDAVHRG